MIFSAKKQANKLTRSKNRAASLFFMTHVNWENDSLFTLCKTQQTDCVCHCTPSHENSFGVKAKQCYHPGCP